MGAYLSVSIASPVGEPRVERAPRATRSSLLLKRLSWPSEGKRATKNALPPIGCMSLDASRLDGRDPTAERAAYARNQLSWDRPSRKPLRPCSAFPSSTHARDAAARAKGLWNQPAVPRAMDAEIKERRRRNGESLAGMVASLGALSLVVKNDDDARCRGVEASRKTKTARPTSAMPATHAHARRIFRAADIWPSGGAEDGRASPPAAPDTPPSRDVCLIQDGDDERDGVECGNESPRASRASSMSPSAAEVAAAATRRASERAAAAAATAAAAEEENDEATFMVNEEEEDELADDFVEDDVNVSVKNEVIEGEEGGNLGGFTGGKASTMVTVHSDTAAIVTAMDAAEAVAVVAAVKAAFAPTPVADIVEKMSASAEGEEAAEKSCDASPTAPTDAAVEWVDDKTAMYKAVVLSKREARRVQERRRAEEYLRASKEARVLRVSAAFAKRDAEKRRRREEQELAEALEAVRLQEEKEAAEAIEVAEAYEAMEAAERLAAVREGIAAAEATAAATEAAAAAKAAAEAKAVAEAKAAAEAADAEAKAAAAAAEEKAARREEEELAEALRLSAEIAEVEEAARRVKEEMAVRQATEASLVEQRARDAARAERVRQDIANMPSLMFGGL